MMKGIFALLLAALVAAAAPRAAHAALFSLFRSSVPAADDNDLPAQDDSSDDNSDKERLMFDDVMLSSAAASYQSQAILRRSIREAEFLYQQALDNYGRGNSNRAREYYQASLQKLAAADLDPGLHYQLRDEFSLLYAKLDKLLLRTSSSSVPVQGKYIIPMDDDNELVKKYLKLYTEGKARELISKALERSGRYRDMILGVLKEYDLPPELVYLPVVESLYNVNDRSRAGALGLWQIMPERARDLGLKVNFWIDERRDPEKSTRAAARYLKQLYLMFDDWHLALAAYNRGEYGLARDLKFSNATNIAQISDRNASPRETSLYVPQFIACTLIGDNGQKYGIDPKYDDSLRFDTVEISSVTDLTVIARCADTSVEAIRELNPALQAWCTPHNYPGFTLLLPPGTRGGFLAKIAEVKDLNPTRGYVRYRIRRGDSLGKIARRFHTTVAAVREDNQLKSGTLRIGRVIVVRPGKKYTR